MYEYEAKLIAVVDGDTMDVELDYGFSLKQTVRLRLANVDTEELHDKDLVRRESALKAKQFTLEQLTGKKLLVQTLKTSSGKERETFGRYVAVVTILDGEQKINLNEELVKQGFQKKS